MTGDSLFNMEIELIHDQDGVIDHDPDQHNPPHHHEKRGTFSEYYQGPDHPDQGDGDGNQDNDGLPEGFQDGAESEYYQDKG
jgi:hypothetical protein